mgnify:CR=1 FL=1
MKKKIMIWVVFACLLQAGKYCFAQTIITEKIERKFSLSPYLGIGFFPTNVNFNDLGVPRNLFAGYSPSPMVGIAAWYKYKKRIYYGGDAHFLFTSRQTNDMNLIGVSALGKLYPLGTKYKITPYFIAGLNLSFVNINQPKNIIDYQPDETDSIGQGFKADRIQNRYNKLTVSMAPMVGPIAGVGIEVKVTRKISAFLQGVVQTSFGTNPLIEQAYPDNSSVLQYAAVKGGVNMKVFKKMKFEIDTAAVKIPDAIVLLTPEEIEGDHHQILNREGNFDVNLREGLRHNLQVSVKDGELNMVMDSEGGPCKTLAVLYDQFGNKIASAQADATGNINFTNLEKGIYNVAFEVQPPCPQSSEISYQINSPGTQILSQGNEEYTPKSDSLAYNIEGFVDFKDPNQFKDGIQVMLVDEDNKMVKSKQVTTKEGLFAFKNLTPGNYKVVYEVGSAKVQSRIAYDVKDNENHIVKHTSMPYNDVNARSKEGTRLMMGKLEMNNSAVAAYKVNLDLVDKFNRVVDHSIPNEDGSFEFIDRKSDHNDVIYELGDKKLEKELAMAESKGQKPAPLVRSIAYQPQIEDEKQVEALLASAATAGNTKLAMGAKPLAVTGEMQLYSLYNRDGELTTVTGFGYQVGAFRNMENVYHLMDKLKQDGFEVYVQAVMSNDIATKFKTSTNYKLNRIIVYGTGNELVANEIKAKLTREGYPIIVKEHFKPTNQYSVQSSAKDK